MRYVYAIVADHEMYAVPPGWRLFAINTVTGTTFEMHGGFSRLRVAVACRDGFIASGRSPEDAPEEFKRLRVDAVIAAGTIDGALRVRPSGQHGGHGFELFDADTGHVAATVPIIGDGDDMGAWSLATVLAAAPVMLRLLCEALSIKWAEFESGENVNGGDLVDAFGLWRAKVIQELQLGRSSSDAGTRPT